MIDVFEEDGALYVEVGLPGVQLDDLIVDAAGSELLIFANRPEDVVKRRYRVRGRWLPRTFRHCFMLPPEARVDLATATFRHGLLQVRIPLEADEGPSGLEVPALPGHARARAARTRWPATPRSASRAAGRPPPGSPPS